MIERAILPNKELGKDLCLLHCTAVNSLCFLPFPQAQPHIFPLFSYEKFQAAFKIQEASWGDLLSKANGPNLTWR